MDIDTSVDVKKLDDKQLFNIADQLQGVGKANE
jgi:hypothetical protein